MSEETKPVCTPPIMEYCHTKLDELTMELGKQRLILYVIVAIAFPNLLSFLHGVLFPNVMAGTK